MAKKNKMYFMIVSMKQPFGVVFPQEPPTPEHLKSAIVDMIHGKNFKKFFKVHTQEIEGGVVKIG